MTTLYDADRAALDELAPLLRRVVGLDARVVVRLRFDADRATALARLPFGVLVSRGVAIGSPVRDRDVTVRAGEALGWLDEPGAAPPLARDTDWRGGLPPATGWRRLDTIPDDVIRPLVRSGALALKDAAAREGVPGAQPRAEVADALLDAVVLTVDDEHDRPAEVTLRALSALTRMGFLARGGQAHVDVAGRWIRIVGGYGSVLLEAQPLTLNLR